VNGNNKRYIIGECGKMMVKEGEREDVREKRIRAFTQIYYSNPKIQETLLNFAKDREVVPRYFDGFGKRPDIIQYASDILGLVRKGATSFHASEEIWEDPLQLSSESTMKELRDLRKGWDLVIDVDSKYFDVSRVLTSLIVEALEQHGVRNYGIKFSGSKGMHILVSSKAFPKEFNGEKMEEKFPEWPRAICEYLTHITRPLFNKEISELFSDVKEDMKKKNAKEALCPECGRPVKKGSLVNLECPICHTEIKRKNKESMKKKLKCIQEECAGVFEIKNEIDFFECEYCENVSSISKTESSKRYKTTFTEHAKSPDYSGKMREEDAGVSYGASDLVLVASRHLFRMPYSLHEKTALASVVLEKDEIKSFSPGDASPLKIMIKEFMPKNENGEARRLLAAALDWQRGRNIVEKRVEGLKYGKFKDKKKFENVELKNVSEEMYPLAIKKLLKGLDEGRKRGLFVLLTFLGSIGKTPVEINKMAREWNEKNDPPLREGYLKSQIDWHLRQKKKILPPNYENEAFYRDIGLIDKKQNVKNPLVDVSRKLREKKVF
jgi:DNA primase catalytic subunit